MIAFPLLPGAGPSSNQPARLRSVSEGTDSRRPGPSRSPVTGASTPIEGMRIRTGADAGRGACCAAPEGAALPAGAAGAVAGTASQAEGCGGAEVRRPSCSIQAPAQAAKAVVASSAAVVRRRERNSSATRHPPWARSAAAGATTARSTVRAFVVL